MFWCFGILVLWFCLAASCSYQQAEAAQSWNLLTWLLFLILFSFSDWRSFEGYTSNRKKFFEFLGFPGFLGFGLGIEFG